jgi:hypothetical protein
MPDRKPLRFTRHVEDAILEREVERTWIEKTAREPEWFHPDPRRPDVERRFRAIPEFGGRVLRVACLETATEIRILTVFFDRDARKPS